MCSTYLACQEVMNGVWNATVMHCAGPETYFYEHLGACHTYCETSDSINDQCNLMGPFLPDGDVYCSADWVSDVDCFHFNYCYQDFSTVEFNV